ncbi:T9SS type B sorting domain-containing protein [Aureispira anguillae]|uniref:Gliding motility-associated C-terminal domain-containing protein n=1 Tax=Aureispira anguillae TaxID=2864201 RepID=A0A915YHI8_9BACT|nr:gliding motility-associated C-terminal domain-containing protein [Aureispira anguillae]BDS13129.1 gliding motility-associated C-terminal domain-containing protein [Aureispira anguillae]
MKQIYKQLLLFVLLLGSHHALFAQSDSCYNATSFCDSVNQYAATVNGPTAPAGNNYDCLSTQPNPTFFTLTVSQSGSIDITLQNTAGVDIDFILWGPYADLQTAQSFCGNLGNGPASSGNLPDTCSYSSAAVEYVRVSNAVAGSVYILMITNFSNQPTNISSTSNTGSGNIACPCDLNYTLDTLPFPVNYGFLTDTTNGSGQYVVCPGDQLGLQINVGGNPTDTLQLYAPYTTINNAFPGASIFTVPGLNHDTISIGATFTPTQADVGTHHFDIAVQSTTPTNLCQEVIPIEVIVPGINLRDTTICSGDSILIPIDTFPTTYVGFSHYQWTQIGGTPATISNDTLAQPSISAPPLAAGVSYDSIVLEVQFNYGGCATIDTVTIIVIGIPDPSFTYPNATYCQQSSNPTAIITGTPGGTFSSNTGVVFANTSTGEIDVANTPTGNHNIFYELSSPGGQCDARDTFNLNMIGITTFNATSNQYFICPNEPNTLQLGLTVTYSGTTPGSPSYSWSPTSALNNPNIQNPIATLITPDTFVVSYNDGVCDVQIDTVEISAPYPAVIAPTSDIVLCNGNSAQIGAAVAAGPGGQSFCYNNAATTIATEDTTYFTINVTGVAPAVINGSLLASLNTLLGIDINSLAHVTAHLIAPSGESAMLVNRRGGLYEVLDSVVFSTAAGNLSTATMPFFPPPPPASQAITGNYFPEGGVAGFNSLLGATSNGTWTLMLIHFNGGVGTGTGTLNDWCLNFQDLSAASFQWSPNNATISCVQCDSPTVNPVVNTTYSVVATNLFGCRDTADVDVVIDTALPSPVLSCGAATISSVTFDWVPVFGAAGYVVSVDGGAPQILGANISTHQVTGLSAGQCVTFVIYPQSGNTCADGAPDTIVCCAANCGIIDPVTIAASGPTTFCVGQSVTLDAGAGFNHYQWSTAATDTNQTVVVSSTQLVSVTTTDNNGCIDTGSVLITVVPGPTPSITASGSTTLCSGDTVFLDAGAGYAVYAWSPTGASQTIAATTTGTHIVTVTDAVGCIGVDSMTVTVGTPLLAPTVGTNLSCNGVSPADGSAVVTASGSFPAYTYLWTDGQNTATATGLGTGVACVTVTDANSCTVSTCVTISEPSAVSVTTTQVNVTCFNGTDGTATAVGSGGTGTHTFSWSNGQNTATATGLGAGLHCVTVTDASGCTADTCITITQPAVTVTSNAVVSSSYPNGSPISCGGTCDGEATASGSGGTPSVSGYLYSWSTTPVQNTAIATGLCVGIYTVTVTDSVGCSSLSSVTLTEPAPVTVTIGSTVHPSCHSASDGQAVATASGGAGGYSYAWNTVPMQLTDTATALADGIYTVTATDANGCTGTESVTITEPSAVTATTSISSNYNGASISCNGACDGALTAVGTGGTGAHTYVWSDGQTNAIATGLCAGAYTVTVLDANGCSATSTLTITEPSAVTATSSSTDALCFGASDGTATAVGAGGTGAFSYSWSTSPVQNTAIATGLNASTGVYTATVSDANGCSALTSVTISEPSLITATISTVAVNCHGGNDGTATATVGGGTPGVPAYLYNWGVGNSALATSHGQSAGSYIVTITDGNGCSITESYTISEPSAMSFTVGSVAASCHGASDGTASINVSGGVGGFTYTWNNGQNTATATGLPAGMHCVTATDGNGCTVDTCIQVDQPAGFSNINFSTIDVSCFGGSNGQATISLSGGIQPYSFVWSNGQNGNMATGLTATTHSVTVTDANGCTVTANVVINEPTALQLNFDVDSVQCKNGSDGQIEALVTGGTFPYTYQWDAATGNQNTAIANGLTIGTYSVVVTDFNGCTITASATVSEPQTVLTAAIINQSNPSCHNSCDGMIEVDAQGATPNYTYQWNNGQTSSIATGVCAGVHTVTITDANGCSITAGSVLTEPSAISLIPQVLSNYNGAAISCPGEADGSVGVTAAGGNGGFSYIWSPAGQNTATINGLVEGTYCVTVTDVAGCQADTCISIVDPVPLAATFSQVDVLCHGDANGQILVNATPGTGTLGVNGYEYKITGPGQSGNVYSAINVYNNLAAGSYVVFVRDGNNCEISLPIAIAEPAPVLIDSVVITDALCFGAADGTAMAHASGGTGTYTYRWSDAQVTNPATGLAKGLYTVTVTDANGCDRVEVFNVGEPTALTGNITANPIPCFGGTTTATASGSGGTPIALTSYVYNWSNGSTSATTIGLTAGVHCVTITDANACSFVTCVTLTQPSTALTASISAQTDATCHGSATGTATAQGNGGTSPYTYQWDAAAANQTSQTAIGLAAGIYTVVVTDSNNCTNSTTVTISEPSLLTAAITATTNATCNGVGTGTATVAGTGGVPTYTYLWADGQTNATATGLVGGSHPVTLTDANGCTAIATAIITEPTAVDITAIFTTPVACKGGATGSATLSIQGGTPTSGYTFQWSGAPGQNSITATGLSAGVHTVTATDANGCFDVDTFTISEPALGLTGYLTTTDALCFGAASGEIAAVITGGTGSNYTFAWNSSPSQHTVVADSLAAGNYTVTVTDSLGCTLTLTGTVGEPSQLVVTAGVQQDVTCFGGDNGIATVLTTNGGVPTYSYVWTDPSGQVSTTATNLSAGPVTVVATDANMCTASATVTITEATPITVTENVSPVSCHGLTDGSIDILTSNKVLVGYNWSNGFIGNPNNGLAAGVYELTVTDATFCTESFSYTITEPSAINLDIQQTTAILCHGADNATAQVTPTGGSPAYTANWSHGASSSRVTDLAPGLYTVTITDSRGCMADTSITIEEPEALTITGTTAGTFCAGDQTGVLTAIGAGGTVLSGLLEYSIDGTTWQNGNIFSGLSAGIYTLSVKDENGCVVDTALVVEDADPFFISSMTGNTTIEYLDSLTIEATLNDTTGVLYSWTQITGVMGVVTDSSYSFDIAPAEAVQYEFTATNANGCTVDSIVIIDVEKPRRANAATGFTPNGDGVNDYFFIQGGEKIQEVVLFRVYDRWGELVFEGNSLDPNIATQGWDGIFRGQPASSGTYSWYADVLFKDGKTTQIKGNVVLLR